MRPTVKRRRLGRPPLATRSLSRGTRPPSLDRIRLLAAVEQDGGSEAHGADHDRNGNLPGGAIGHPVRAVQVALEARRGASRVAVVVAVKGQVRGSEERGSYKSDAGHSDRERSPHSDHVRSQVGRCLRRLHLRQSHKRRPVVLVELIPGVRLTDRPVRLHNGEFTVAVPARSRSCCGRRHSRGNGQPRDLLARRLFWGGGLGHGRHLHPRAVEHRRDLRQHLHLEPRATGDTGVGQPHLLHTSARRRGHMGWSRFRRRLLDCGGEERLPRLALHFKLSHYPTLRRTMCGGRGLVLSLKRRPLVRGHCTRRAGYRITP